MENENNTQMPFMDILSTLASSTKGLTSKFKYLLEGLSSQEETKKLVALMELASDLSMAQDSTLTNSMAEQLIGPVLECLSSKYSPDMMINAMTCLTQIIDLCPTVCTKIVQLNGVTCLVERLFDMSSIEITEAVIKVLDKVSLENPYIILQANGLMMMIMCMPFIHQLIQKRVLKISCSLIKSVSTIADLDGLVLPIIPNIIVSFNESKNLIDDMSEVVEMICACVFKLYKFNAANIGFIKAAFYKIFSKDFADALLQLALSHNTYKTMTHKSYECIMSALIYAMRFCPLVLKEGLEIGTLEMLGKTISPMNESIETTTLMIEAMVPKKYLLDGTDPLEKEWYQLESEKESTWMSEKNAKAIEYLGKFILPNLVSLFEERSSQTIKLQCVQSILKILELCDSKVVQPTLESKSFALLVFIILDANDILFTALGLLLVDKTLKINSKIIMQLKREGIEHIIKNIKEFDYLTKIKAIPAEKLQALNENAFIKYFNCQVMIATKSEKAINHFHNLAKYIEIKSIELLSKIAGIAIEKNSEQTTYQQAVAFAKNLKSIEITQSTIQSLATILIDITHFELIMSGLLEAFYNLLIPHRSNEECKTNPDHAVYDKNLIAEGIAKQRILINGLYNSTHNGKNGLETLIALLQSLLYTMDKPSIETMLNDLPQGSLSIKANKQIKVTLKYSPIFPSEKKSPQKINDDSSCSKFYKLKHDIFTDMNTLTVVVDIYKPVSMLKSFLLRKLSTKEEVAAIKDKKHSEDLSQILGALDKNSELYQRLEQMLKIAPKSEHLVKVDDGNESDVFLIPFNRSTSTSEPDNLGNLELSLGVRNMSENSAQQFRPDEKMLQGLDIEFMYNGKQITNEMSFHDVLSRHHLIDKLLPQDIANTFLFKLTYLNESALNKPSKANKVSIGSIQEQETMLLNYIHNFKLDKPFNFAASILLLLFDLTTANRNIYYDHCKNIHIDESMFSNKILSANMQKCIEDNAFSLSHSIPNWVKQMSNCFYPLVPFDTRCNAMKFKFLSRQRFLHLLSSHYQSKGFHGFDIEIFTHPLPRNKIKINRKSMLEIATKISSNITNTSTIVEFDFANEEGTGLGPTLEFYHTCIQAILAVPDIWMITHNNTYYPSPYHQNHNSKYKSLELFHLLGSLTARSIIDDRVIELPLSSLFWDVALNHSLTLADIRRIDPMIYRTLEKLHELKKAAAAIQAEPKLSKDAKKLEHSKLNIDGKKVEELGIYFVMPGNDSVELKEKGSGILVTIDNIEEYLQKLVEKYFADSVTPQIESFRKGFESIFPLKAFDLLSVYEIEDYFSCSSESWTADYLKDCIKADHGYTESSMQFQFLIQYMLSLDKYNKKKFIQYTTGTTRLPKGGIR